MLLTHLDKNRIEAGCDEAGRGCLAGPVVAAAVILPSDFSHPRLDDSKKMTDKNREALVPIIHAEAVAYGVAEVSPQEIDQINIFNILRFYKDFGIDLQINQFQNETKKELFEEIKNNAKKMTGNFYIMNEKKSHDTFISANNIYELENLFENFNGCNLKKTATNFVKFQGNKNAHILFVDGTPDTEEDKSGKSFVSSKGDLFEKMLNAIHLKREDIFIVNAIPWRPPGNRYPTEEEIKICRPFIFNLIKIIKPIIIVCLGEVPTNQILDSNQSIIKLRGKWHSLRSDLINQFDLEYNPYILPTLNITYLLNRPDMKRKAWDDMKLLRDKISEI